MQPVVQLPSLPVSVSILAVDKSTVRTVAEKLPLAVEMVPRLSPAPAGGTSVGAVVGFGFGVEVGVGDGLGSKAGEGEGGTVGISMVGRMSSAGVGIVCCATEFNCGSDLGEEINGKRFIRSNDNNRTNTANAIITARLGRSG